MQKESHFFISAGPLLLILFIDGMGLGLVFPLINGLIFDKNSTFLTNVHVSPSMYNVIYGAIMSIFMLCWFFGAAILGDLSDQIGRKKSLIICLAGTFLSYLIAAISVTMQSLTLFIIGRIIAGFTSGSQPIAQAAIIDISKQEQKARNIGFIFLSISLGFIFGPLIGGVLSDSQLIPWFNFSTPFYFTSMISFINIILLLGLFKETSSIHNAKISINPYHAITIFISAFKNKKIRKFSILFFIFMLGWSSYYGFISLFLIKTYSFTPTDVSIFLAILGVGFGIGNGYLVNYLSNRYALHNIFMYSILVAAIITLLTLLIHPILASWIMIAPLGVCVSIAYATLVTLFSNQVDANSQGWVMGISVSVSTLAWALNTFIVGAIAVIGVSLPIFMSSICLFITALCTYYFLNRDTSQST